MADIAPLVEKTPHEFDKDSLKSKDMKDSPIRYCVLALACMLCFGSYFVYDNPSALAPQLMDTYDINSLEFNLLYSVYSFPNIVLPFFGGYLVDFLGVRIGICIFSGLVCLGQAIFAFSADIANYPVALVGRIVFGLGGESLNVAQSAIVAKWFEGKEMAMALGLNVSISRLGSVLNDWTEPAMAEGTGSVVLGLWVGFVVCVISLGCGVWLCFYDWKRDKQQGIDRNTISEGDRVKISDIRTFGKSFWLISFNCMVVYICVMPFNNIASIYFQKRFGMSSAVAGLIISITYIISAVLSPFIGRWVDKFGHRVHLILFSAIDVTVVHISLMLIPDCDGCYWGAISLAFLGLGYAVYAAVMWAAIPYTVEAKTIGTAFGVATAVQNFGLAVGPLIVGGLIDGTSLQDGYFWASMFFIFMGALGIISAILLGIVDKNNNGVLNSRDPRLLMENLMVSHVMKKSEVDSDLPENIKNILSSPTAQRDLRNSYVKRSMANK